MKRRDRVECVLHHQPPADGATGRRFRHPDRRRPPRSAGHLQKGMPVTAQKIVGRASEPKPKSRNWARSFRSAGASWMSCTTSSCRRFAPSSCGRRTGNRSRGPRPARHYHLTNRRREASDSSSAGGVLVVHRIARRGQAEDPYLELGAERTAVHVTSRPRQVSMSLESLKLLNNSSAKPDRACQTAHCSCCSNCK
jgi:hypothetical protein